MPITEILDDMLDQLHRALAYWDKRIEEINQDLKDARASRLRALAEILEVEQELERRENAGIES